MSKEDTVSIQDHLANFVSKYKTVLLGGIILLVTGALGFGIMTTVIQAGLEAEDQFIYEIEEWQREQLSDILLIDEDERQEPIEGFILGTEEKLVQIDSDISLQKVMHFTASTLYQLEQYESSVEWYKKAFEAKSDSLIGLYSLKGQADALSQLDQHESALNLYIDLKAAVPQDFPMQDEILMTLGSLYEKNSDKANALETYNRLVNDFADSNWTKLARSRILVLE
jgi:tetratricopeptide (TPR) repeat protein